MARRGSTCNRVSATLGFAASDAGEGVAYVRLTSVEDERVLRVPFDVHPNPALRGVDVTYAAVVAALRALRREHAGLLRLRIDDASVVKDVNEHRSVHPSLAVSYVEVGCALNRFRDAALDLVDATETRDLNARARADVSLHVAA